MNTQLLQVIEDSAFWIGPVLKLIGYTLFLQLWFEANFSRTVTISLLRTILGTSTALALLAIFPPPVKTLPFYLTLSFIRIFEWSMVVRFGFHRMSRVQIFGFAGAATLVSAILDIPVLLGWFQMKGFC